MQMCWHASETEVARGGVFSACKMESLISSGGWLDGKKSNDVSSYFPRPRNISFRISALPKGIFLRRGKEMFLRSVFHLPWWIGPILRQPTFCQQIT